MSFAAVYGAATVDIPPAPRLVLMCVERHANGAGVWAMTHEDIAWEMCLSRETVRLAVAFLVREGYLAVQRFVRRRSVFRVLQHATPRHYRDRPGYQGELLDAQDPAPNAGVDYQDPAPNHPVDAQDPAPNSELDAQDPATIQRETAIVDYQDLGVLYPTERKKEEPTERTTPESVSARAVAVADGETPETLDALDVIRAWNGVAEACRYPFEDEAERTTPWLLRAVMTHGKAKLIEAVDLLGQPGFFRDRATKSFRLVQLSDARMLSRIIGREFLDDRKPKTAYQQKQADYVDTLMEIRQFYETNPANGYATQEHSA